MTPANIALAQFTKRRAWLAANAVPVAEQERRLRPWAAIALRAGADPAAISPDVAAAVEAYRRAGLTQGEAHGLVAVDLCPKPAMLAELARARNAALEAVPDPSDPKFHRAQAAGGDSAFKRASQAAQDLQVLAALLGAPPYLPSSAQQEAA
jgi:hypothetical protein